MGMYTAFNLKCRIKKEKEPVIKLLLGGKDKQSPERTDWETVAKTYPEFLPYSKVCRCDFIPFGAGGFLGQYWGGESFCKTTIDEEGRMWFETVCTLKDYEDTIQSFCDLVLPLITDKVEELESWYEENEEPYKFLPEFKLETN